MEFNAKKVLFISAHADDAEFGCGGVITKLANSGVHITSVVFSGCEDAADPKHPKDIRRKECVNASKIVGIQDLRILDFPVRKLPAYRQEILQYLYDLRKETHFDIVFTHWEKDVHQDHAVIAHEAFRAFKGTKSTLLSYEVPLDCQGFSPNVFVPLTKKEVETKLKALWEYKSELERRPYFSRKSLEANMRYRGPFVGEEFAEAFEMRIMYIEEFR
ncbi:MAG: LmbE family protein [Candidatus Thorarchaeota archaeon]|nr:MAG: LmbE family protein [Candidatus Thorarchaeota archaeon]